jgi:hypothetical protein
MKKELEEELPLKVKESSECLNLRKMEEYMVKQKKYLSIYKVLHKLIMPNKGSRSW